MEHSLLQWHKTVAAETLADNTITEVALPEKKVCLLRSGGQVYAFAATCPHSGARLCEGWMDARNQVVCPLHKYRFDPRNGRNTTGEGYKLKTYPVDLREGFIFVGLL